MSTTKLWPLVMLLLLAGCGIGGHWMEGSPYTPKVKPYIEYWEKPDMTEEDRLQDWMACGGRANGNVGFDVDKLAGETFNEALRRVEFEFQRCVANKGYFYTGNCIGKRPEAGSVCEFSP